MRRHLLGLGVSLAMIAACGGSSSIAPASSPGTRPCVNAGAAHHAYVVVQHLDGRTVQGCVGFAGEQIGGGELMARSGIQYRAQTFSGIGEAVCQIDREPARFTECLPRGQPYWALYVETGRGPWADAQAGYAAISLRDGDALGWQYRPPTGSPPPPPPPSR